MDGIFKKLCVFLSYLLIASTVLLVFTIPAFVESDRKLNFFSTYEIAENVKNMELNMTSVIYVKNTDGNWEEYQRLHGSENRIWVGISKIPENLQNALIAIEDERFKTHSGVDWKRTLGAIGNFVLKYSDVEFGGSTITQQLIKNITSDNDRSPARKFREIVRATMIEHYLDKTQILEAYLNTISLGNGICGVQVAANYYFNKDVSELNLTECACLAAITKNPTEFNPVSGEAANKTRRNTVLDKMLELEMITEDEYKSAYNKDITLDRSQATEYETKINSYFVDALIEQVIADLSEKYSCNENIASTMLYNGGYKIYATVNPEIQSTMESVYLNTDSYFNTYGTDSSGNRVHAQSAMTIMDYEGHIVGLVGGAGEKTVNRGLNRATGAPRQPGSTMKPIGVYALAVENDLINYTSRVLDQPIKNYYPDGRSGPKEWYGYYMGSIRVDYALRHSVNTVPVRLLQELGIEKSYDFLKNKLKFKYLTEQDKNLSSLALGGCVYGITTTESAAAFSIFGSDGIYHEPTTYYRIERVNGETVLDYDETGERVISSATATIMNHLLQGVVYGSGGTGTKIASYNYSMKAYAKTGTSSEANDLWMVAGTPYYIGSVWYGFDKMQAVRKNGAAAVIWRDIMKEIHKDLEVKQFTDSDDVYKKGSAYYKKDSKTSDISYTGGYTSQVSSSAASSDASSQQSSVAESSKQPTVSEIQSSQAPLPSQDSPTESSQAPSVTPPSSEETPTESTAPPESSTDSSTASSSSEESSSAEP